MLFLTMCVRPRPLTGRLIHLIGASRLATGVQTRRVSRATPRDRRSPSDLRIWRTDPAESRPKRLGIPQSGRSRSDQSGGPCVLRRHPLPSRPSPGPVSRRPWLDHWLESCRDLAELKASHPMVDAVIDEIDGRMIRVGDQWLADFASCNYLGFDLDREIIEAIPAYLDAWGTHPSWSRLLGSPGALRADRGAPHRADRLRGLARPADDHPHPPVGDPAAGRLGHDLPRRARPQDDLRRLPGRPRPRRRRPALPLRGPRPPRRAAGRRARSHAPGLHGRRELDDRQPAGPAGVRRGLPQARRAALRRRRPRLRRHRRARRRASPTPTGRAATASSATSTSPTTT